MNNFKSNRSWTAEDDALSAVMIFSKPIPEIVAELSRTENAINASSIRSASLSLASAPVVRLAEKSALRDSDFILTAQTA
jgi:hypothetical protein